MNYHAQENKRPKIHIKQRSEGELHRKHGPKRSAISLEQDKDLSDRVERVICALTGGGVSAEVYKAISGRCDESK